MKKRILILLLIIASLTFCISKQQKFKQLVIRNENINIQGVEVDAKYLITEVEVDRVKVGDSYKTHKNKLKVAAIENGEDFFNVYDLYNSNNEKIALVYMDPYDPKTINTIAILSPKYKTEKGIGVGSTFKEIKETYPECEVHGSEIEGRTVVMVGDYHFLLEGVFFDSYIVDESKIKPSTRIKEVILRK
ncbi:hypothetical protein [Polaribacter sp.]|uniref:hypothetical protein n=1 Tax=Polaribacter sp. TaxID=1920175 RepID=UPI003F6CE885